MLARFDRRYSLLLRPAPPTHPPISLPPLPPPPPLFSRIHVFLFLAPACLPATPTQYKEFRGDASDGYSGNDECPFDVKPPSQDIETTKWFQNCKP